MQLIIIQGQSATGKSTLATRLAKDLDYPVFLKDAYKEAQFDKLGRTPGLIRALKIEGDSWQAMYSKVREAIASEHPLIIEGNFRSRQREAIQKLLNADIVVVEVFCFARGLLPLKRYVSRNRSGERHKGHLDHLWYLFVFGDIILSKLGIKIYRPLRLSDAVIKVDTTDFRQFGYSRILKYIASH